MSKDPEFLILKHQAWMPSADWEKILGASVQNHLDPGQGYAPENVRQIRLATAKPAETKFENFILQTELSSSGSFQLEVKGLGKLRWEKSAGKQLDLRGKVIYIKRLQQRDAYWKAVMKNQEFRDKTAEWINKAKRQDKWWSRGRRPVCMVVGVMLCEDVEVCLDAKEAEQRIAKGEAPLGTVAELVATAYGIPLDTGGVGNVSAESLRSRGNIAYFKAKGKQTYVCGVELRVITIKKDPDDDEDMLEVTDQTPKADRGRTLGPDDEDVDPDNLPWQAEWNALGEEDWEVLLRETPEDG